MPPILNIATYRFTPLENLSGLKADLERCCNDLGLKGTILLASEGINLFLAGPEAAVRAVCGHLEQIPAFQGLDYKESWSAEQPFQRLRIKIKKEIVTFNQEKADPARYPAPRLTPEELNEWLDQGKDVVLLDTRNDFEWEMGTFVGAQQLGNKSFRDFAEAVLPFKEDWQGKPIVAFCTGGIRCEKAAPYLIALGHSDVYQLEGGILRYFEKVGQKHWQGACFVFDERVGLDPKLQPTQ